ncbi:uncharacterized protein Z520_00682 [Fonsecaea multimorphosa CBS 102226]|uniref:Uncharacterized protein n=1 Tax=Fonsecaea multimorphosa CBS 102226 TaxID=1442371 RepID=A0A0D2KKJ3_9EURO|nr:uncharacterized protein Z520_00682 [Fonsecaea multimorphosa CBS 102226]KIY03990.1 hypothetical protein Z520_00682 [Fonsecaea multimorphosa CBS 102226]OAL31829.1 hypothetical protein AYO22_00699 [Fonsecaea multimorphosa]
MAIPTETAATSSTSAPSSLHGKVAVVTGGSRGIGAGIALQFARKGIAAIAITYATNLKAAEETLSKCRSISPTLKTVAIQADVLDPSIGPNLIPKVLKGLETDRIDIVVNNAALVNDLSLLQPFGNTTVDAFGKTMQGNVFAPISIINSALPHFPPKGGRVINISSVASKLANADPILTYGASKAALDSITRSLANVLGISTGATFNSVSVGATTTDTVQAAIQQFGETFVEDTTKLMTAEKRFGEPDDIAFVVGFLASEEARWINGAHIMANGGYKELLALQG